MLIQGTLDGSNNVIFPTKPLVWVDDGSGGGGGGGSVSVSNFPATQPVSGTVGVSGTVAVSGPITNAQLTAVTGTSAQTAVTTNPAAAGQTMLAVLRGILAEMQAQTIILEAQQLLLDDIKTNTTPAP